MAAKQQPDRQPVAWLYCAWLKVAIDSDQFAYECQGSWSTNVLSWTQQRHARLHLVRYEDML